MDTNLKIKEEESFPADVVPQSETEFFCKVVSMNRNSDAVLVDYCCDVPIKTEIKSEASFTKHLVKLIKSEAVTCSSSWEIHGKAVFDEETLSSGFGLQSEEKHLSEGPVTKLRKFNTGYEMGNKIEIKEESLWQETETSATCDDIKDGDFPPVNVSRSCAQEVSSSVSGKSLMIAAEVSGRGRNVNPGKDNPEYQCQICDDTEIPSAEEHVLSEQAGKCRKGEEIYKRLVYLKQNTLIHKSKRQHTCKACNKSFPSLSLFKRHNLTHEGSKPHQCKTCGKIFTRLGNLKTHYLIHEGKKEHQCNICDKSFTQLAHLKTHYLIHDGKRPHHCKTCDKSFALLSALKRHYFTHEGKKPHQCKACNKSFIRISSLKSHYLLHVGKKPHN